jgi:GTP 3',8-cyclase
MPLDAEQRWERAKVMPSARIVEAVDRVYPLEPVTHGSDPATSFRFADGVAGGIGVIASVSQPFCDTCNRLRLTAEGQFRACLFSVDETDLRGPLRSGASDREIAGLIRTAVWGKWEGHKINHPDFERPKRSMSMIGG